MTALSVVSFIKQCIGWFLFIPFLLMLVFYLVFCVLVTPVALDEPFNAEALRKLRPSATGMALPLHDDDQTWELNPEDEMANVQVIDEFYYDQVSQFDPFFIILHCF